MGRLALFSPIHAFMWLAIASAAPAMEVDDLRLVYAPALGKEFVVTGQVDYETDATGQSDHSVHSISADTRTHDRFGLAYRRSPRELRSGVGAFLWGLELGRDRVSENQNSLQFHGETWLLDGFLGWSWKVLPGWHLEQGVLVGMGRSRWQMQFPGYFSDGATWNASATGFAYEYGFAVAGVYTFSNHAQLIIDVRHLLTQSDATLAATHDVGGSIEAASFNAKFAIRGYGISAGLGYRF